MSLIKPDWMKGAVPRLVPVEWQFNQYGRQGRTADAAELGQAGWGPVRRRNRKGAMVTDRVRYTPCTWSPTARQVASARRRYLDWWGNLLTLQVALRQVGLRRHTVQDDMPPMTPWRNSVD